MDAPFESLSKIVSSRGEVGGGVSQPGTVGAAAAGVVLDPAERDAAGAELSSEQAAARTNVATSKTTDAALQSPS